MGAYSYKLVRDQLPPYLTTEVEDYEGGANYDGDQWSATADYIDALEREIAKQDGREMTMPYVYESKHHHTKCKFEFETLEETIRSAAVDFELGEAWPGKIIAPDGEIIWEQSGPLTTGGTLEALAKEHGVEWPDL